MVAYVFNWIYDFIPAELFNPDVLFVASLPFFVPLKLQATGHFAEANAFYQKSMKYACQKTGAYLKIYQTKTWFHVGSSFLFHTFLYFVRFSLVSHCLIGGNMTSVTTSTRICLVINLVIDCLLRRYRVSFFEQTDTQTTMICSTKTVVVCEKRLVPCRISL